MPGRRPELGDRWTWKLVDADGAGLDVVMTASGSGSRDFASQSDAETWLGEAWRELAAQGVAAASLTVDGRVHYGPMPLAESTSTEA